MPSIERGFGDFHTLIILGGGKTEKFMIFDLHTKFGCSLWIQKQEPIISAVLEFLSKYRQSLAMNWRAKPIFILIG